MGPGQPKNLARLLSRPLSKKMKKLLLFTAIILGLMWGIHYLLSSGQLLIYLDENPELSWGPSVQYYVALVYRATNTPEKASIYLEHLLKAHPEHELALKAHYQLAKSYDSAGRFRAAYREYEKVIYNYPENEYTQLCINRLKLGNVRVDRERIGRGKSRAW